jgi:hypothetical protein
LWQVEQRIQRLNGQSSYDGVAFLALQLKMIVGIAADRRPWNSSAARAASGNRGGAMFVKEIIPDGSSNNT